MTVIKLHFKLRHSNREETSCNAENSAAGSTALAATATDEDKLWIIDALGMAVTNNDQLSIIKLADSQTFHHFLMILSCVCCLWARYDGYRQ